MFDLPKFGRGICLARVDALLSAVGIDRRSLQSNSVVVTGSNGKGSTSAFCESIGRHYGLKTGLFTSPHLLNFAERFKINGVEIDYPQIKECIDTVSAAIVSVSHDNEDYRFGAFEAQFVTACLIFQKNKCDFMIFEAGIGGRYDPTRLVDAHVASVTSVDLEHTDLLGKTLELILLDKTDSCAVNGVCIYGRNCLPFKDIITVYNRARNVKSLFVSEDVMIENIHYTNSYQSYNYNASEIVIEDIRMNILGDFQIDNSSIAACVFLNWITRSKNLDLERYTNAVVKGIGQTRWPGRLERISRDPLIVVDVGHTPDGIRSAIRSLKLLYGETEWVAVTGVSSDKDVLSIIDIVAENFTKFICTSANHKGASFDVVRDRIGESHPASAIIYTGPIEQAANVAKKYAEENQVGVFVVGGLFLAVEFSALLRGDDPASISFF